MFEMFLHDKLSTKNILDNRAREDLCRDVKVFVGKIWPC